MIFAELHILFFGVLSLTSLWRFFIRDRRKKNPPALAADTAKPSAIDGNGMERSEETVEFARRLLRRG